MDPPSSPLGDPTPSATTRGSGRGTLAGRLGAYAVGIVAVMALVGLVLDRALERRLLDDLTSSVTGQARAVREALPRDAMTLQPAAEELGADLGIRITVIAADGVVLADSWHDPATMQNHAGRPEIRAALSGAVGTATRVSETVREPFRYVALPLEDGRIVRVAVPLDTVESGLGRVRILVATGAGLGGLLGVVAVLHVARNLTRPLRRMTHAAGEIAAGRATGVPVEGTDELAMLAQTINRMAAELGRQAEEAEQDRRTRELILAAMAEGVVLVDAAGEVRYANPAAERLLQVPVRMDRGQAVPVRFPLPHALHALAGEVRAGDPGLGEIEAGYPSRILTASAIPAGSDGLVLLVLRDVTDARRVEAIRRDFAAAASHELKTPVASLRAAAETMLRAVTEDPAAARRFAERLLKDAERLSGLVSDLLDLSRLESERPTGAPVRFDLLVRVETERFRERAFDAGLALEIGTVPVTVAGSAEDLSLLVRNLVDNAVRYTRPGGRVSVDVVGSGGDAVLTVADTGMGIPSRDLTRIFERFYRVDRARSRETGGTGLGLAIVKHVAEAHGGRVEAMSELGKGSSFRVAIPRSGEPGSYGLVADTIP